MKKVLIIRFSSFGDILQCLSVVEPLRQRFSEGADVYWLTKSEFAGLVRAHSGVKKVISFEKKSGFLGLLKLLWQLRGKQFDFIYDAHSNPRSAIAKLILLGWQWPFSKRLVVRKKDRWKRFFLFNFGWNFFEKPFRARRSFLSPVTKNLEVRKINLEFPAIVVEKVSKILTGLDKKIVIIPGAAWALKQWPEEHWISFVKQLEYPVIILGGPAERELAERIFESAKAGSKNLVGELSLLESSNVIAQSDYFVSNDTGLLHVGDLLEKNGAALIGPTAFGYPSSSTIRVFERNLPCRPCTKDGRGNCYREINKQCLLDIRPGQILEHINNLLN